MSDDSEMGCAIFVSCAIGTIAGLVLGGTATGDLWTKDVEAWRLESVRRGAAEWVMDPATGKTEWRWKEPKL